MTMRSKVETLLSAVSSATDDLRDVGGIAVDDVSGRCSDLADELETAVGDIDLDPDAGERCPFCARTVIGEPRDGDAMAVFVGILSEYVSERVLRDALRSTVAAMQGGPSKPVTGYVAEVAGTLAALARPAS